MRAKGILGVFADLSAKLRKILEFLKHFRLKYLVLLVVALAIAHIVLGSASPRPISEQALEQVRKSDSLAPAIAPPAQDSAKQTAQEPARRTRRPSTRRLSNTVQPTKSDTLAKTVDSVAVKPTPIQDTTAQKPKSGSIIDQVISGKNTDSSSIRNSICLPT